jgi:hypothetical protein
MKLSTITLLALIVLSQFITVSSDCIRLKTSGSSNTYGSNSQTDCFDFVTFNTTYSDPQGNLRHGPISVLAMNQVQSGAESITINPIIGICLACTIAYMSF